MVRRSTWIVLVIFVILAAFAWWYQRYQAERDENTPTGTPTIAMARVFFLSATQVAEIDLSSLDGSQIVLYRDVDTTQWAIKDIPMEQADGFKIGAFIGQLLSTGIMETLPGNPDLGAIGLAQPEYTVSIRDVDGSQYILYIGVPTPIGTGYYARLKTGEVVVLDNLVVDNVIDLLSNPPLLPTATPETTATGDVGATESAPAITPAP